MCMHTQDVHITSGSQYVIGIGIEWTKFEVEE